MLQEIEWKNKHEIDCKRVVASNQTSEWIVYDDDDEVTNIF